MQKDTQKQVGATSHLTQELGLLKDIINRVADELGLPTESGNRVHDVLFWLDSPKPEQRSEALSKAMIEAIESRDVSKPMVFVKA